MDPKSMVTAGGGDSWERGGEGGQNVTCSPSQPPPGLATAPGNQTTFQKCWRPITKTIPGHLVKPGQLAPAWSQLTPCSHTDQRDSEHPLGVR